MTCEMKLTSLEIEKTISPVVPCWRTSPLTRVVTVSVAGSTDDASTTLPTGQKVSSPLARVH